MIRKSTAALQVMRVLWIILTILALGLFAAGIPQQQRNFTRGYISQAEALGSLGMSAGGYARYQTILDILLVAGYAIIGIIIFWRSADSWLGLWTSLMLITFAVTQTPAAFALDNGYDLARGLTTLSLILLRLTFYLFPDGKFVPRWTWVLGIGVVIFELSFYLPSPLTPSAWPAALRYALELAIFATGIYAQVYRYRRVSDVTQRQQIKWVILGAAVAILGYYGTLFYAEYGSAIPWLSAVGRHTQLYLIFWQPLRTVTLLLVPLTLGVSVLRYRLWDMAVVVNRALVYGTLVLLLALSYVIVGVAFQWALSGNIGMPASPLAIILATAATIALYPPIRARVQTAIDRRFYQDKVDLARNAATFTHEMRMMIELSELLHTLVSRINTLLSTTYSAVFLKSGNDFLLAEADGALPDAAKTLPYDAALYEPLRQGTAISPADAAPFPLIMPLIAQHAGEKTLVGALAVGPRPSGTGFSSDEQALIMEIVDQAGTAIHVGQLVKEKRRNDELLHSVIDLAVMFSAEKRFEQLLERILLEAKGLCHADGGTLYLYDDHDHLEFVIMHNDTLHIALGGATGNPIPFAPLPLYDAATGTPNHSNVAVHAALTRQTVNIPDAYHAEGFDFSGTKAFDQKTGYRSRSFLTVPLQSESGDLLGVLQLINARNPGADAVIAFSIDLQKVVESLSTLAALALAAYIREQNLRAEIRELRIAVDLEKKERQVAQITESDYFQKLQNQARELRARATRSSGD